MSERYTRIFEGEHDLYTEGSPVLIKAHVLLRDNEAGKAIAQIKFQNTGETEITYLKIRISAVDAMNNVIEPAEYFEYNGAPAGSYETFGQNKPFTLKSDSSRSYTVSVIGATLGDGTVWQNEDALWHVDPVAAETAEKALTYKNAVNKMNSGKYNDAVTDFDKLGYYANSVELHDKCVGMIKKIEDLEAERVQKKKKTLIKIVIASALVIAAVIWFVFGAPYVKYDRAYNDYYNGKYSEAYKAFDELGHYKNAPVLAEDCAYRWAVAAFENNNEASAEKFSLTVKSEYSLSSKIYDMIVNNLKTNNYSFNWDFDLSISKRKLFDPDTVLYLLEWIPDDFNVSDLKEILKDINSGKMRTWNSEYVEENEQLLRRMWDYIFVQDYLQSDYIVTTFLNGEWNGGIGDYSYKISFTKNDDGTHSFQYNLPHDNPAGAKYYDIENMSIYLDDESSNHLAEIYRITMTGYDYMTVYCTKDKSTHYLYRR
ncbi:MAG: hypothetical protein II777_10450 [Clostridia bacterium]|nr:hypothetical protein [Clostridia bacterium]